MRSSNIGSWRFNIHKIDNQHQSGYTKVASRASEIVISSATAQEIFKKSHLRLKKYLECYKEKMSGSNSVCVKRVTFRTAATQSIKLSTVSDRLS